MHTAAMLKNSGGKYNENGHLATEDTKLTGWNNECDMAV